MTIEQKESFEQAVRRHDGTVAEMGLSIWLGAEPTFTDRFSEAPEWLYRAEGGDKATRALRMMASHCRGLAGPLILRTLGRQYPGEELPRWNFGIYQLRNGAPAWLGPPDPILGGRGCLPSALERFADSLCRNFLRRGWKYQLHAVPGQPGFRIAYSLDELPQPGDGEWADLLARPSIHSCAMPKEGLRDALSEQGVYLIDLSLERAGEGEAGDLTAPLSVPKLELPAFPDVASFLTCIGEIAEAAKACGLEGIVLAGYPPPVDDSVAWTTFTPDPAVIEVNMAPFASASDFHAELRALYQSADEQGLSAYRFYYNGDVTDSGGGGQITFGGPSPLASPFFLKPRLLPNVIRYFNRHPCLSYFFTPTCVGSSSQSPRPDERYRESFEELRLELGLLDGEEELRPDRIWASLSPFLSDTSGNSHRTEINVEKLWNPYLTGRGCLGLVEFRAFRMGATPEILTARAVLFRALLAMLAERKDLDGLIDWGRDLHDRFALPYYLKRDLREVFQDLSAAGLDLGDALVESLLNDDDRLLGAVDLGTCRLSIHRALEFWPLAGDSASQEQVTSRLIDSSTNRVQIALRPHQGNIDDLSSWRFGAGGWKVSARHETDAEGPLLIFGLRYRAFMPWNGLHPGLKVQTPVEMTLENRVTGEFYRIVLHEWKPETGGYEGLPGDWEESRSRRGERIVVSAEAAIPAPTLSPPPLLALTSYCLDLRACPETRSISPIREAD